jgi:hypothetical protein
MEFDSYGSFIGGKRDQVTLNMRGGIERCILMQVYVISRPGSLNFTRQM